MYARTNSACPLLPLRRTSQRRVKGGLGLTDDFSIASLFIGARKERAGVERGFIFGRVVVSALLRMTGHGRCLASVK